MDSALMNGKIPKYYVHMRDRHDVTQKRAARKKILLSGMN
jgi:hypothetical protein